MLLLASLSLRIPAVASIPDVSNRFRCCWFCTVAGCLAVAGIPAVPDASPLLLQESLLYRRFLVTLTFMLLLAFPPLLTFLPLIVSLILLASLLMLVFLLFPESLQLLAPHPSCCLHQQRKYQMRTPHFLLSCHWSTPPLTSDALTSACIGRIYLHILYMPATQNEERIKE
jgi:hypothetical protein